MEVRFKDSGERTNVAATLREIMRRFYEGDGKVANGIISELEKAIACVEATPTVKESA